MNSIAREPKDGSFFVSITPEVIKKSREYAEVAAKDFNPNSNYNGEKRSLQQVKEDATAGKVCEFAINHFLKESFDISMEITHWNTNGVDVDLIHPQSRKIIEVKCSSPRANWLLLAWSDIWNKQVNSVEPDVYIMCRVDKDDLKKGVEIVGYAAAKEMRAHSPGTRDLRRGEFIPGTKVYLKTNNIARNVNHLHNSKKAWARLAEYILEPKQEQHG